MEIAYNSFFKNKNLFVQFLFLILFIIGGSIIGSCLAFFILALTGNTLNTSDPASLRLIQALSSVGAFLLPSLLFSFCSDRKWLSYSSSDKFTSGKNIGIVALLSVFILPLVMGLGYWNEQIAFPYFLEKLELWMQQMQNENDRLMLLLTDSQSVQVLLINLLVMAAIPAVSEEFLFRGTVQPFLAKIFKNNFHLAIWITAFIFSAIHLQFYGFIPRFLLGAYLGYLAYWSRSLWLPIIAHFLHNGLSLVIDFFTKRNGIDLEETTPDTFTGYYPVFVISLLLVIAGIILLRKSSRKARVEQIN